MTSDLILRVEYQGTIYDLPVDNEVPLRVDMSAVESGELGRFFGIGSQTFNLAGTKLVNRFFNHAYDVSQDDIPGMYNTLTCSVILDGETLIIGSLQLVQVITNDKGFTTYEVQVVDKVVQFEQALATKLIKNADWSAYTHTLTSQSIVDSWSDNLLGGAVYYPMADYGRSQDETSYQQAPMMQITASVPTMANGYIGDSNSPMTLKQTLPAIRVKDTLDVIFDQAGFTYTGSFTETADFNNLYILNKPKEGLGVVTEATTTSDFSAGSPSNQSITGNSVKYIVSASSEFYDYANAYNPATFEYTIPETGNYRFEGQVGLFNPVPTTSSAQVGLGLYLVIDVDGTIANAFNLTQDTLYLDNTDGVGPHYLNVSFEGSFAPGTVLRLQGQMDTYGGGPTLNATLVSSFTQFQATNTPVTYQGASIDMSLQWQADTKSIDVLKGLLTQFNLVMTPQEGNKTVIEIEQFDDWIRRGEIKDWTSKYDTAKRISINHTVDELERELFLKNADDNDRFSKLAIESDPNEQYGTLRLLADNNISQGSRDIESLFAPVILGGAVDFVPQVGGEVFEGSYNIDYSTKFVLPHIYKWNNKSQESYISKPRLGYKVTQTLNSGSAFYIGTSANSVEVTDSYATIANVGALPIVSGSTNDLHFNSTYTPFTGAVPNINNGVSSFNRYWKTYYDSLYWEGSKKVTLDLFFEPYEYKQIQLNDRVLIKGQAYRINKISGFNVSYRDVVRVELIKLYPAYWQIS